MFPISDICSNLLNIVIIEIVPVKLCIRHIQCFFFQFTSGSGHAKNEIHRLKININAQHIIAILTVIIPGKLQPDGK